ncbi:hypothetical protein C4J81_08090 [Deltaproteobacteria bacterium Smac51]|nr:hypothetical protein C4J81_08090 [Deltaproteobacteria bacterium Smac51]
MVIIRTAGLMNRPRRDSIAAASRGPDHHISLAGFSPAMEKFIQKSGLGKPGHRLTMLAGDRRREECFGPDS